MHDREPAEIDVVSGGHRFIWRFRECQWQTVEALIEYQCVERRPGFESLHCLEALEAMRDARRVGRQYQLINEGSGR